MDQAEQRHMAELGIHTDEFRRFMEQPSVNMDDSGMFSVQVLTSALRVWDLTLVPFASSSSLATAARLNPTEQQAYICNFKEHWLTVRKLGHQWFNLNSLLSYPELISNTYLALFLKQLQHEGYSIFVVDGNLPPSEADETLRLHPAVQTTKPKLLSEISEERRHSKEDGDLKAALAASLASVGSSHEKHDGPPHSGEYYELLAAMQLSLENASPSKSQSSAKRDLQPNVSRYSDRASPQSQVNAEHSSEDENLQAAIRLSLGQHSPEIVDDDLERALQLSMSVEAEQGSPVGPSPGEPSSSDHRACVNLADRIPEATATHTAEEPDLEEIRQRRLAFLSKQTP
ncbi:ataxin-3 isoform X3 [Procambarus clarkii]